MTLLAASLKPLEALANLRDVMTDGKFDKILSHPAEYDGHSSAVLPIAVHTTRPQHFAKPC